MDNIKIKVGLIGLGHLGKIHLKCLKLSPYFQVLGVWDIDKDLELKISSEENLEIFPAIDRLMHAIEAVFIISPTSSHFEWAMIAARAGKHMFIEKPITATLDEALRLKKQTEHLKIKIQVGHVERFNPAYLAVKDQITQPLFIEGHRLAEFKPRGTDVSVIMDLMIHDIDLVLAMVDRPITEIRASGVAVMSPSPDICNARLEFEGGAVANLTASRISLKQMRKLRLFQPDEYISLDLLAKESQVVKISDTAPDNHPFSWPIDTGAGTKHIQVDMSQSITNNAILDEINSFALSILEDLPLAVSLEDGLKALAIAEEILKHIDTNQLRNSSK